MHHVVDNDRVASRREVLAHRAEVKRLAAAQELTGVRIDEAGVVIVHVEAPGYTAVRRFAVAASDVVGAWVNTVTDDTPAGRSPAERL